MSVGRKVFCVPVESNATIAIVTRVGIQRLSSDREPLFSNTPIEW